jgi:protein-disulfide isomerase
MRYSKAARKLALAAFFVFAATLITLLARQLNLGPARAVPPFRAFGPKTAEIQISEYTDFACPACKAAYLQLETMLKLYDGHIALAFKHYPLVNIHKWSFHAAAYADCAGEQGKFREYAALLFENQELWARAEKKPAAFLDYAEKLKLDPAAFEACANKSETIKRVKLEMAEGDLKGVAATPTFFINGKRSVGAGQLLDAAKNFDNLIRQKK